MRGVTGSGAVGSPVPEPRADAARLTARVLAVNHHRPAQIAPARPNAPDQPRRKLRTNPPEEVRYAA
jgi:hypothetical protein